MLLTHPRDADAGMKMARKIIGVATGGLRYIMHEGERPHRQNTRIHLDRGPLIPVLVQNIMITLDQPDP